MTRDREMDTSTIACCNGKVIDFSSDIEMATLFKALGDERRLSMVRMIAAIPGICACEILDEFDMSQSTLSHHMNLLCSSGLVSCDKQGKWMHYSLSEHGIAALREFAFHLE